MNFLGIFRAQNNRLVIGYLMGPILVCGSCLKRVTDKAFGLIFSNHHNFGVDFLDIFCAQNDCLVIGYLMGTEIL